MRRSSDRGQFEPVVALAAVLAVSAGLVAYADTLERVVPDTSDRDSARIALDAVHDDLRRAGLVEPDRLTDALGAVPNRWSVNVTLRTRHGTWKRGRAPPPDALRAKRTVSVRLAPAQVRPGILTVVIWR